MDSNFKLTEEAAKVLTIHAVTQDLPARTETRMAEPIELQAEGFAVLEGCLCSLGGIATPSPLLDQARLLTESRRPPSLRPNSAG